MGAITDTVNLLLPQARGLVTPDYAEMEAALRFAYVRPLGQRDEISGQVAATGDQSTPLPVGYERYGLNYHPTTGGGGFSGGPTGPWLAWSCAQPSSLNMRLPTTEFTMVQFGMATTPPAEVILFGFFNGSIKSGSLSWLNGLYYVTSGNNYRAELTLVGKASVVIALAAADYLDQWVLHVERWRSGEKGQYDILTVPNGETLQSVQSASTASGTLQWNSTIGATPKLFFGMDDTFINPGQTAPMSGYWPALYIFDRRLRDEEVQRLAANPFGPVQADLSGLWGPSSTPGGIATTSPGRVAMAQLLGPF